MSGLHALRSLAYGLWFYGVTLVFCLAGVFVRLFARGLAQPLAQSWAAVALAGLPICGVRVVVTGLERLPSRGPLILGGQHQSEFDTLIWMKLLDRPSYVMKQELQRIPLFGPLLVPAGMIPLDRAAGAAALRSLVQATARARDRDRQIVIFPEGTRVPAGQSVALLPGIAAVATRLNLPVYPVATDSGTSWPRGLLAKRPGVIHVAIGPPICPPCRREELLARIEAYWRSQAECGFRAVDNSVETRVEEEPRTKAPIG